MEDLVRKIQREIWSHTQRRGTHNNFVTGESLRDVWDKYLESFIDAVELGFDIGSTQFIGDKLLGTLSILIYINWTSWGSFGRIFINHVNEEGTHDRLDNALPQNHDVLEDESFLGARWASQFFDAQFIFLPITIRTDGEILCYSREWRLPFVGESVKIGAGGFGSVTKEIIAPGQLVTTLYGAETVSKEEFPVARKVFKRKEGFKLEIENLRSLRENLTWHKNIASNIAAVIVDDEFNIFFELADMDLHRFLYEPSDRSVSLERLIREASNLASAITFLHETLSITGQRRGCCHGDLKPDDILVYGMSDSDTVGKWKISDFGISSIAELEYDKSRAAGVGGRVPTITPAELTLAIQRTRTTGIYQAPETRLEGNTVGRRSDIWSFGCIFHQVLAFGLGGTALLKELDRKRAERYRSDYFYRQESPDSTPILHPDVSHWVKEELPKYPGDHDRVLLKNCSELLQAMLTIAPLDRPYASEVHKRLEDIKTKSPTQDQDPSPSQLIIHATPAISLPEERADVQENLDDGGSVSHGTAYGPPTDVESKGKSLAPLTSTDGQTWTRSADRSTAPTTVDPEPPRLDEETDAADKETIYTSATNPDTWVYIDQLADDLFNNAFSEGLPDSETLQRVSERLPRLLQGFALKIGGESQEDINGEIMSFVYRKRERITKSFQDCYSQEKEDDVNSRKRVLGNMSPQELVDRWPVSLDGFDWTSTTPPQNPLHEAEEKHEEAEWGSDDSGDEGNADSSNILSYGGVVAGSSAYTWLLSRLHREVVLSSPQNAGMHKISEDIRGRLYSSLGHRLVISKTRPPVCKMVFHSDWNPLAFVREQEYTEEPGEALEGAITITEGDNGVAEAMPCSRYLCRTWPCLGEEFVALVKGTVRAKPGSRCSVILFDSTKLVAWVESTGCFALEAVGVPETLVEVGEVFAWMTAALRSAPGDEVAIVVPSLAVATKTNEEMTFKVQSYQPARRTPSGGQCWQDLFRNPVVVHGFPVRRRPGDVRGLEITLNTLAMLLQTRRVTIFGDRVLLKGFCTMLVPTQYAGGTVFWHVLFNEDGSRISFADGRVPDVAGAFDLRKALNIGNMETTRHIVGWCSRVKINTGAKEAAYDIEDTSLPQPLPEIAVDRFAISIGKLVSFSGILGRKEKPVRNGSQPDFFQRLQSMDDRYVVLYDVEERRAWLVHALSALLHLVRASLKLSEALGYPLILKEDDIQEAGQTHRGNAAARVVLANPDNLRLKIFKNPEKEVVETTLEEDPYDYQEQENGQKQAKIRKKRVTKILETWVHFSDRVDDMCHLLESVFDHQHDCGEKDGVSVRMRTSLRRHLEGFQFKDLASAAQKCGPRAATLRSTGAGWVDFVRAIGAVTLFGNGFGELLKPAGPVDGAERAEGGNLCDRWVALPEGEDLLAVSTLVIRDIMKKKSKDVKLWELVDGIYWHKPDKAFEQCDCAAATGKQCDRVQVLIPTKFPRLMTRGFRSPASLPEDGAVIFGHSVTFPLIWGDDPQSVPSEGHLPPESPLMPPSQSSLELSTPSSRIGGGFSAVPSIQQTASETTSAPSRRFLSQTFARIMRLGKSRRNSSFGENSEASGSGDRL